MGVFGEAIYGHIGQYAARVYNAQYVRSEDGTIQLVNARGLSEQDTLNRVFGKVAIGPHNDSAVVLALDTEIKGHSWVVRAARQTGSAVSGGFCHAMHSESSLTSLYRIDSYIYFPFIPNGEYCVSLIRDPSSFNAAKRWERSLQAVPVIREEKNRKLGWPLNIPAALMKRLTSYIVSQASINAKQYLYIRVPDQAPYEPYCLAALHDILTLIPAGLRAGISAATNCRPQDEQNYGIIFQRASFPERHETDINLHANAPYPFLNNIFINPQLRMLMEQIVDYPELTDKCYRTMERAVFGDSLPKSFQSYENYYGISTIQKDKSRPTYLEECNSLLKTTNEPTLRKILESIVLDEYKTSDDLEAAIDGDPAFEGVNSFASLSEYLNTRRDIISFLERHGIHYSKLFIFRHLNIISRGAGVGNTIDLYEKIISEQQDLTGLNEEERRQILNDCREAAWKYFSQMRAGGPGGWDEQSSISQYNRLVSLDERINPGLRPPVNEQNWFNGCRRRSLLNQFKERALPETASQLLSIPNIDPQTGNQTCLTDESSELITFILGIMKSRTSLRVDPETAERQITEILQLSDIVLPFLNRWSAEIPDADRTIRYFRDTCEEALYVKAVDYTSGSEVTGKHLSRVIDMASARMPLRGAQCVHEIQVSIADRIRKNQIPYQNRTGLYQAASASTVVPDLQSAYSEWVGQEIRSDELEEDTIRYLFESVRNPDIQLQQEYAGWSEKTAKTKDLLEKMKASKTLIKYLNVLISANGKVTESEIAEVRRSMWKKLTIQERTISAYTASIAYLFQKSAEMVLCSKNERREAAVLKEECRLLADKFKLGIYLDPYLSISELLENVRQYMQWTEMNSVVLYSRKNIGSSEDNIVTDAEGRKYYFRNVDVQSLQNTLESLLCLLNDGDYRKPEGARIDANAIMNALSRNMSPMMAILEKSGIISNNSDLTEVLSSRGWKGSNQRNANGISTGLLRNVLLTIGALLLTFGIGMVFSHFVWPGHGSSSDKPEAEVVTTEKPIETATENPGEITTEKQTEITTEKPTEITTEKPVETTTGNPAETTTENPTGTTTEKQTETTTEVQPGNNGETSVILPEYEYTGKNEDFRLALNCRKEAATKNNIIVSDNMILLPGIIKNVPSEKTESGNPDYLAVKYCLWEYNSSEAKLTLKNPDENSYIGYIKITSREQIDAQCGEFVNVASYEKEKFETLPEEVRKAISALKDADKFDKTVKKNNEKADTRIEFDKFIEENFGSIKKTLDAYIKYYQSGAPEIEAVQFGEDTYVWDNNNRMLTKEK